MVSSSEDFNSYGLTFEAKPIADPVDIQKLTGILQSITEPWLLEFYEGVDFYDSNTPNLYDELTSYFNKLISSDTEHPKIKLTITKNLVMHCSLACYDTTAIIRMIKTNPLLLLNQLKKYKPACKYIQLVTFNKTDFIETSYFSDDTPPYPSSQIPDWDLVYQDSHFLDHQTYPFKPSDFLLSKETNIPRVNQVMNWWALAISICHLANHSNIIFDDRKKTFLLKATFFGTKPVNITLPISQHIDLKLAQTWKNYTDWVFDGPGVSGRLGVFRNIFTMHAQDNQLEHEDLLTSIKQSYSIFLNKSADDLISTHKKILEGINTIAQNAQLAANSFAANFRTGFVMSFSYCTTAYVLKNLSSKNVFSVDAIIIGFLFLLFGICHFIITDSLTSDDIDLLISNQKRSEKSFQTLLKTHEFQDAFNKPFSEINRNLGTKIIVYRCLWGGTLILFIIFLIWALQNISK